MAQQVKDPVLSLQRLRLLLLCRLDPWPKTQEWPKKKKKGNQGSTGLEVDKGHYDRPRDHIPHTLPSQYPFALISTSFF